MSINFRQLLRKLRGKSKYNFVSPQLSDSSMELVQNIQTPSGSTTAFIGWGNSGEIKVTEDTRKEVKPIEVFQELTADEPQIDLNGLDKKIEIVKRRSKLFKQLSGSSFDEDMALKYLRARKNFPKYGKLFVWKITTDDKIQALCKQYKVQLVSFGGYKKNVPMEALDQLEKFLDAHEKVTDVKPDFSLIVDSGGKETRKDPILLARSPFGKWYYILGAWDKEVEIVDDLIYKGK